MHQNQRGANCNNYVIGYIVAKRKDDAGNIFT